MDQPQGIGGSHSGEGGWGGRAEEGPGVRPSVAVLGARGRAVARVVLDRFLGPMVRQPCWEMKELLVTGHGEEDFGAVCAEWSSRGRICCGWACGGLEGVSSG